MSVRIAPVLGLERQCIATGRIRARDVAKIKQIARARNISTVSNTFWERGSMSLQRRVLLASNKNGVAPGERRSVASSTRRWSADSPSAQSRPRGPTPVPTTRPGPVASRCARRSPESVRERRRFDPGDNWEDRVGPHLWCGTEQVDEPANGHVARVARTPIDMVGTSPVRNSESSRA